MTTKRAFIRMARDARKIIKYLAIAAIVEVVAVVLSMISPTIIGDLSQTLFDFSASGTPIDWKSFSLSCALLLAVYAGSAACSATSTYVMNNTVSRHFTCSIRKQMSKKISALPMSYLNKTPNGEIISRMMTDVSVMGTTAHTIFSAIIGGAIQLVAITVVLFCISPLMALVALIIIPSSIAVSAFVSSKAEKHFNKSRAVNGRLYSLAEENFSCFDTVKAFNLETKQNATFGAIAREMRNTDVKAYFTSSIVEPIVGFTNSLTYIIICLIGGYMAINGIFSVGLIVTTLLYCQMFSGPLSSIASGLSTMQNAAASAKRVYEFLDSEESPKDKQGSFGKIEGAVKFENVRFSYDKNKPLVRNLNVDVKAGQKVAIVGPTGGGKTTIVNLLMRFYDADEGRIFIDGVDASSVPVSALRSIFQMVLQDAWLFSGTVAENVAYGKPDATREEIIAACKKARVDGFVNSLPNGYDTFISEQTTNVSVGQKQLLTIARAFLSDGKILVLDEATSNVDTRTEILIQQSMNSLMRGRTSFVIAHRLSTIVDADLILVVDNGSIVESGTHAQLLEKKGFYYEIYQSQYAPTV